MNAMDDDPTVEQLKIVELPDRVIITTEDVDTVEQSAVGDDVDMYHVVDAEIVEDDLPPIRWHPEAWRVEEPERFPGISATVMHVRPGAKAYAYVYRVDAGQTAEIIYQGVPHDTVEVAKRNLELWLYAYEQAGGLVTIDPGGNTAPVPPAEGKPSP